MTRFFDDPDEWFNGTTTKTKKSKGAGGEISGRRLENQKKLNMVKQEKKPMETDKSQRKNCHK